MKCCEVDGKVANAPLPDAKAIRHQPQVQLALKQTSKVGTVPAESAKSDRVWLATQCLILLALGLLDHFLKLGYSPLNSAELTPVQRWLTGAMAIVTILVVSRILDVYGIALIDRPVAQYNLRRILRLAAWAAIVLVVISVLFANWYTAVVSLSLISLVLGFSLQTPITSFIGWIYILIRVPYAVGDRIKIGGLSGDVIDVSYLDTTLWEFGGEYLSTDHPSGRIIKLPNSNVLSTPVINYTWPLFPYIWNEVKFYVAYDSDFAFVEKTMQEIAAQEIGEAMMEGIRVYRDLLASTPVDELEVQEQPTVFFRISENTWVEAIVRYLVLPREAGRVKSKLLCKMLQALNKAPEKVAFPKGSAR